MLLFISNQYNMTTNFVLDYLEDHQISIIESDPNRPWGGWYITEINREKYLDKKILRVVPQTLLSLQFHGSVGHPGHKETWVALTKIRAVVSTESLINKSLDGVDEKLLIVDVEPQGILIIEPGCLHALANPFGTDIYVVETRESQIAEGPDDRERNIVRIYDQTMRNGVCAYPKDLFDKIMNENIVPDLIIKAGEK
jgi:hypothetical protein